MKHSSFMMDRSMMCIDNSAFYDMSLCKYIDSLSVCWLVIGEQNSVTEIGSVLDQLFVQ